MHTPFVDKSPQRRGLRQRLTQILLRSSCTTNTSTSTTAFVSLAKTNADSQSHLDAPPSPYFCTPCTYERPKVDPRRRRSRSASLVHISVDCTGGAAAASGRRSVHSDAPLLQHPSLPARDVIIKKQSKGRRQTARSPSKSRRHCPPSSASWGRARPPRTRSTPAPYSWSSSSTATDDELEPFSSDEEGGEGAETRTLFSSLSFSSDSTSDFYHTTGGNSARNSSRNTARRAPRRASLPGTSDPAAPTDAFRPLVSVETKKHKECNDKKKEEKGVKVGKLVGAAEETGAGMAVVKRSSNPYADFRSSMVDMVVERRIGSVGQMEELLGSYLSLNSPRHHPAILAAFEDVWEAVFGEE